MMPKYKTHWGCLPRSGLTLIEVTVGLSLLATLLVMILLATQQHAAQLRRAQQRLEAVRAADQLLMEWYQTPEGPPESGEGTIESGDGKSLSWSVAPAADTPARQWHAKIARLVVFDEAADSGADRDAAGAPEILAWVEFLVPTPIEPLPTQEPQP